jgi:hypothetical protein
MIKMLYNSCTGIYKFGNNAYPRRIRRRSNLGHIFGEKKCVLWAGKYGIFWNSVKKIQVSLKSDKNNGYFKCGPIYICDISPISSWNEKCLR